MPHSPQRRRRARSAWSSSGREPGTLDEFQWYCPNCDGLVHRGRGAGDRPRRRPAEGLRRLLRRRGRSHLRRGYPAGALPTAVADELPGSPVTVVDLHTHFFPQGWPDLAARFGSDGWPWMRHRLRAGRDDHDRADRSSARSPRPAGIAGVRLPTWTATASTAGGVADARSFRLRPPGRARGQVRPIFNDLTLETLAGDERFVPFCQVPLQDPDLACRRAGPRLRRRS